MEGEFEHLLCRFEELGPGSLQLDVIGNYAENATHQQKDIQQQKTRYVSENQCSNDESDVHQVKRQGRLAVC
jgi:hypothetical protein